MFFWKSFKLYHAAFSRAKVYKHQVYCWELQLMYHFPGVLKPVYLVKTSGTYEGDGGVTIVKVEGFEPFRL